jgi:putative ABC transport system permease protein
LLVLRIFPLPVRLFAWLASLRRDLVPSLALRRVARQPAVTALPLLVLLLAVAVAVFSSVMLHSIESGQVRTAWQTVGADYRVDPVAGGSLYTGVDLTGKAGIEAVAQAFNAPDQVLSSKVPTFGQLNFLAIDAPNYEQVTHGTPVDPHFSGALLREPEGQDIGTPSNPLPAIVSSNWVQNAAPRPGDTFAIKLQGREVSFVVSQVRDDFITLPKQEPFVVATLPSLQAVFADRPLRATNLFLRAPASSGAAIDAILSQQSSATRLVSRADEYAKVHDAPLISGTARGFQIGVLLAAAYSTLAIVIALALTARTRARDLAFLRTLGLSEPQAIGLVAVELGPPIAVALAVGVAMGVGIARLIEPGIDLTAFTGPDVPVPLLVDWSTVLVLAIGLIVIVSAAVWLVGAAARRANLGAALRLGDE